MKSHGLRMMLLAGLGAVVMTALPARAQNGACCKPDGTCQAVTAGLTECNGVGGFYLGDGATCAGALCGRGACVTNPVLNAGCSVMSEAACLLQEGHFAGVGTNCTSILDTENVYLLPGGGQVNVSGSSALQAFFEAPASTNDFLNVDGDHIWCRSPNTPSGQIVDTGNPLAGFVDSDCDGGIDRVDQLAPNWTCPAGGWWGWWLVQYRSVGSIEGFVEFTDSQLDNVLNYSVPNPGDINRTRFATNGVPAGSCTPSDCNPGVQESNTPVCPDAVDLSVGDVPVSYTVLGPGTPGDAQYNKKPAQTGYGQSFLVSHPNNGLTTTAALASLHRAGGDFNLNPPGSADGNTLYNSTLAWVPFAIVANRGTGLQNVRISSLQYLWITGRLPTGENLVAQTRDAGSGTRNATMNSLSIDPSFGRGDNIGPRTDVTTDSNLGLCTAANSLTLGKRTQPTHYGTSTVMRNGVTMWRLGVGYDAVSGSAGQATSGNYEILNVCKDVDSDGFPIPGYTCPPQSCDGATSCPGPAANGAPANNGYIRPSIASIIDNASPTCGWQIGGLAALITRGDPLSPLGAGIIPATSNPQMPNAAARDYVRNILGSIAAFVSAPGTPATNLSPGQLLATSQFLPNGIDSLPATGPDNPTHYVSNPGFSQATQDYVRCNNTLSVPAWGSRNVAGKAPVRNSLNGGTMPPYLYVAYSDGSTNGQYIDASGTPSLPIGVVLNQRNQTQGDFNYDGRRNWNDIVGLMKAILNPRAYETAEVASPPAFLPGTPGSPDPLGGMGSNYVVPEIIGDFNGDGNFDSEDIRYFADGLALDPATGILDRKQGFTRVDDAWFTLTGNNNYFGTAAHSTGAIYKSGDSRGDVSGSAEGPAVGSYPTGHDGFVDAKDIDYVYKNRGNWGFNLGDASRFDLSCDMDGDLIVDQRDVDQIVHTILCTEYGDVNLDGSVNATDRNIVLSSIATPPVIPGWANGDLNGDGAVNAADLAIVDAHLGFTGPLCLSKRCGDIDGDNDCDAVDLSLFADVLLGHVVDVAMQGRADMNSDAKTNGLDVQRFVCCLLSGGVDSSCP